MCDRVVLRLFLGTGVPFSLVMPTDVLMYTVHSWKRTWTPPKLVKIHGICRCFSFSKDMCRLFRLQSLVVQMMFIHFAGISVNLPKVLPTALYRCTMDSTTKKTREFGAFFLQASHPWCTAEWADSSRSNVAGLGMFLWVEGVPKFTQKSMVFQ